MQRREYNPWACFIPWYVSNNTVQRPHLDFFVLNLISEAVSYCANIKSSIQTIRQISSIDKRLEELILDKAQQKELWSLQTNFGLNVYVSLWTGSMRNGYSTLRHGFQTENRRHGSFPMIQLPINWYTTRKIVKF